MLLTVTSERNLKDLDQKIGLKGWVSGEQSWGSLNETRVTVGSSAGSGLRSPVSELNIYHHFSNLCIFCKVHLL